MMPKLSVIIFLLSIAGIAAAAETVAVDMKSSATVDGARITLGDVARIETAEAALARQFAAINLGAAPLPGNARTISRKTVLVHLVRQGINADAVAFTGARFCVAGVRSVTVRGEDIARVGRTHLLALPNFQRQGVSVKIARVPGDKVFSARGECPALSASAVATRNPWGNILVYVRIRRGAKTLATVPVTFRVMCKIKALVAARSIPRGKYVSAKDIKTREIQLGPSSGNVAYVTDLKDIVEKQVVRAIAAETFLTSDMIFDPYLVERGQAVKIDIKDKGLEIVTRGIALANARLGDTVMVKVIFSGKKTPCMVIGKGTVTLAAL